MIYVALDDPFMVRSLGPDTEALLLDPNSERTAFYAAQNESSCSEPEPATESEGRMDESVRSSENARKQRAAGMQRKECAMCQKTGVKLRKCAGCAESVTAPMYCSTECQTEHWNLGHKRKCQGKRDEEKHERKRLQRLAAPRTAAQMEATQRELSRMNSPGDAVSTRRA